MAFAAIMVHVDANQESDNRLRLARELASRLDASLIAVAARAVKPGLIGGGDIVGDYPDERDIRQTAELLDDLGKQVRALIGSQDKLEWRSAVQHPLEFVLRECAGADLLIIARDPGQGGSTRALDVGHTVMKAGRPVLIVPSEISTLPCRRVLIAWKNTREARRALRDALPLLRLADEIALVEYSERTSDPSTPEQLASLARYLSRHGAPQAAAQLLESKANVAREIIDYAEGFRADLIVAGGYGLSPIGEFIFGGVTRDLVANSPVCCLLSH